MKLKAAIFGLVTALAVAAFSMFPAHPGLAMGGKKEAPVGTGAGLVRLGLNGTSIPLAWVYATHAPPVYRVLASNELRETFSDWTTLLAEGYQILIEVTLKPDAVPPYTKSHFKRMTMAYSWGPGRATSRGAWDEKQLAAATWLEPGEMTAKRWKATLPVPRGSLGTRDVVLGLDVDLKRAPSAQ